MVYDNMIHSGMNLSAWLEDLDLTQGFDSIGNKGCEKMQIEQLIISMQKRPKMFLKEVRIDYIYYFLSGYCGANNKLSENDMDRKFCLWFSKWLVMWIINNVDAEYSPKTAYWYDDIRIIAKKDQDEINMFFKLCNIFFEDYRNKAGYFSWRN